MLLGGLLSFLFSLLLLYTAFSLHFGSSKAAWYVVRKIFNKKMTIFMFLRNEIFTMTTDTFLLSAIAVILQVVFVGLFSAFLLPNYENEIIYFLTGFSFFLFGISCGSIFIINESTGGIIAFRGFLAQIIGLGVIIVSVVFLALWINIF